MFRLGRSVLCCRHKYIANRQLIRFIYSRSIKNIGTRFNSTDTALISNLSFQDHYNIRSNIELLIQDYSKKNVPPLSYDFLTEYKTPLKSNEIYILNIKIMNYLLTYTCKQLTALQQLPYIAILNPKIEQTYSLYLKTLTSLLSNRFPYDLFNKDIMLKVLNEFLNDHQDTLQILSDGMKEIMQLYPRKSVFNFLNTHLKNRITMKLLATHYVNLLSNDSTKNHEIFSNDKKIGIIQKDVKISELISRIYDFVNDLCLLKYDHPPIHLNFMEGENITFSCIPIILEYVMTEILKNSMRATIEKDYTDPNVPREIQISLFNSTPNELVIRVRDFGGGIPPAIESKIFDYSYTTAIEEKTTESHIDNIQSANEDEMLPGQHVNNIAGMGFGLPLCKTYLELFGGKIDIQSLWGQGTDAYIKLTGPSGDMFKDSTTGN